MAETNHVEALKHPLVGKIIAGKNDWTPLHYLARVTSIIKHPDVAKAKDRYGNTPLHVLALMRPSVIRKHPMSRIVKNNKGETPMDIVQENKASY